LLKTRIIPVLLSNNGLLIKGRGFATGRVCGSVVQAARVHERRGVDELVVLDIGATKLGCGPDISLVDQIAGLVPLTVGGGVRSVDDARALMFSGADKIAIGTASHRPGVIEQIAERYGSQAVVASIDVKDGTVFTESGTVDTGKRPELWAQEVVQRGAGEILLCSIPLDGTMEGYDLDLVERVSQSVPVPVVASGGCSGAADMVAALDAGAHGVAAGALFQYRDVTPRQIARDLEASGKPVRIDA
jgi:cyclase